MNIVQIGTNRGTDDLTKILINTQPDKFIIVEPMSIHNDEINKCYSWIKNKFIENIAITPNDIDVVNFYYHVNDGPGYEVSSTDENHILKHGYSKNGIVKIEAPCLTINKLFEKYSITLLDILFIDAEGLDDAIIKSINFDRIKIKKIFFENLHLKSDINTFLNLAGYDVVQNVGHNNWTNIAEYKN